MPSENFNRDTGTPEAEQEIKNQEALKRAGDGISVNGNLLQHFDTDIEKTLDEHNGNPQSEPETKLLAGRFKTSDDLAKGIEQARNMLGIQDNVLNYLSTDEQKEAYYNDLNKEISQRGSQKAPEKAPEDKPEENNEQSSTLDVSKYEQEYLADGQLSQQSYDELEKAGYSPELVNRLIRAEQAIADQSTEALMSQLGGKDSWNETLKWAEGLSDYDKQIFNRELESNDPERQKTAALELSKRHKEAVGYSPKVVLKGSQSQGSSKGDTFYSNQDMINAMKDPRYKSSPEYRKSVEAKIDRSMKAGTI